MFLLQVGENLVDALSGVVPVNVPAVRWSPVDFASLGLGFDLPTEPVGKPLKGMYVSVLDVDAGSSSVEREASLPIKIPSRIR